MKNRSFLYSGCVLLLVLTAGCAPVLIATGAAVGYAVSRDSATLDLDHSREQVWNACVEEVKRFGEIKREDPQRGRLDARVEGTDVVLTLKQLTSSTLRVTIRARRTLLPKPEIAQRLGFSIQRRVESGGRLL